MNNNKSIKFKLNMIKKTAVLAVFTALFLFMGCTTDLVDELGIQIFAKDAGFDGYYSTDGESINQFQQYVLVDGYAVYEKTVTIYNTLEIRVSTLAAATALDIRIYRDGELVKELTKADLTDTTSETLTYIYNEEEN